jgi:hypothetical protein
MEEKKPAPGFPPINLPEDLAAKYSNVVRISHTPSEIIFDFAALLPGVRAEVFTRILMSPLGAKMFLTALMENLNRYEMSFGPIQIPAAQSSLASDLFKNIHPPEKPEPPPESEE